MVNRVIKKYTKLITFKLEDYLLHYYKAVIATVSTNTALNKTSHSQQSLLLLVCTNSNDAEIFEEKVKSFIFWTKFYLLIRFKIYLFTSIGSVLKYRKR